MAITEVPISPRRPERFRDLLGAEYEVVERAIVSAGELFRGRAVWNVNSTAKGGGVVELLTSLLAYARGAGIDTRWSVIAGEPEFFRVTKRIHNRLHGVADEAGALGPAEREIYERTLAENAADLAELVRPGDIVILHDAQTAGLTEAMKRTGATVVWRCHIGLDAPNETARETWEFLRGYIEHADAYVYSRREHAWEGLDRGRLWIIPPSIDVFSPKNQDLSDSGVRGILAAAGIGAPNGDEPVFTRVDETPGRVDRRAEVAQARPLEPGDRVVAQVSRWDRLKDPIGLLELFAARVRDPGARLLLVGPAADAVADDPEGAAVLAEVRARREALGAEQRDRIHLATLPMDDVEENGAIVNAIQRRADVVVQKSIAEGFGLTVAEAMWKARPVVAAAVGGIRDQIVDGESGILIDDPTDGAAFAAAIDGLLADPARAARLGAAARERVRAEFLGTTHLLRYLALVESLLVAAPRR